MKQNVVVLNVVPGLASSESLPDNRERSLNDINKVMWSSIVSLKTLFLHCSRNVFQRCLAERSSDVFKLVSNIPRTFKSSVPNKVCSFQHSQNRKKSFKT